MSIVRQRRGALISIPVTIAKKPVADTTDDTLDQRRTRRASSVRSGAALSPIFTLAASRGKYVSFVTLLSSDAAFPQHLHCMITPLEIRIAYLCLLGREPEPDAYLTHAVHATIEDLRAVIFGSEEGQEYLRGQLYQVSGNKNFTYHKNIIVFVHWEKTGGTTLHSLFVNYFGEDRSSPINKNWISRATIREVNQFDYAGGHISYQEALSLPSVSKTVIMLFRDPFERLLSLYRFFRAHREQTDPLVKLAKTLDPKSFFSSQEVRCSDRFDNSYLRKLCEIPEDHKAWSRELLRDAVCEAFKRIDQTDLIGITDDLFSSIKFFEQKLRIDLNYSGQKLNVSDQIHLHDRAFNQATFVERTDELEEAIDPLVRYDVPIFDHAKSVFYKRIAMVD